MPTRRITRQTYWRRQLQRTLLLLGVWFVVGCVMSIFLIEPLNALNFGGLPFGFWMAQQGSIFVFIILVLVYAISAGRLDRAAGVEETSATTSGAGEGH